MTGSETAPLRRILMTADAVGGVWTYALSLAGGLAAQGIGVSLALTGPAPDREQRAAAATIPGLSLDVGDFPLEWQAGADPQPVGGWLLDLERRVRPDVVQVNGFSAAALPFRAPVLCVAHSCVLSWWQAVHGEPAPPTWARYAGRVAAGLALADLVVAPSRAMLAALTQHYGTLHRAAVIHNGADPLHFRPLPRKRSLVVGMGRLWDEGKNLTALDAVAPWVDWPVWLAGDTTGPDGGRRAPLNARHLGRLPPERVAALLGEAAIFAHPARYEPFGLAPLEAALSGCALVLGDIQSLRELWGGAALFVDPEDRRGLARALVRLIDDPGRRAGLALAARRRARAYGLDRMVRGYRDAYARLVSSRSPSVSDANRPAASGSPCESSSSSIPCSPAGTTATPISCAALFVS